MCVRARLGVPGDMRKHVAVDRERNKPSVYNHTTDEAIYPRKALSMEDTKNDSPGHSKYIAARDIRQERVMDAFL